MHIYRRQARNLPWHDEEDERTHKPFKRFRIQNPFREFPRRTNTSQLETGDTSNGNTEGALRPEERRRRRETPEDAGTSALLSPGSSDRLELAHPISAAPELSMRSTESMSGADEQDGGGDEDDNEGKWASEDIPFRAQLSYILRAYLNILLLAIPTGVVLRFTHSQPIAIFFVNLVAIIPSSAILGRAMDELGVYLRNGSVLLGLISFTFGNAVQLSQSILLLKNRQVEVLKVSLLGNIMSNLFLLTGLSFLIGGFKYFEQPFNREMTQTITMLLFLAVFSLVIPTASYYFLNFGPGGIGAQSRGTATVIITSYGLWLYFDLKTHKDLWRISSKPTGNILWRKEGEEDASRALALTGKMAARRSVDREPKLEEPVENEEPRLTVSVAVVTIIAATSLIAMNMQFFSDSIQGFSRSGFFSGSFHTAAVKYAVYGNMDVAISLTLSRCMQSALFVVPLTVLLGWIMGIEEMTLQFDPFSITTLFIAMVILGYVVQEGKSNWLVGALLVKIYVIIALACWFGSY